MNEMVYRPGLEGIIAGETAISTILGGLRYRGYAIEDLASHASFEEVAYLILHGELPNQEELSGFLARLHEAMEIPEELQAIIRLVNQGRAANGRLEICSESAGALGYRNGRQ